MLRKLCAKFDTFVTSVTIRPIFCTKRPDYNDRRYVHANHLIPDDARGMSAHKEIVTPEMVEYNPPLDFQREPVVPETTLRIQSEVDNEISRKSSVIAVPVVDDDSNVESGDNCGLRSPDQVVTKPVMPSHSESRPSQVVTLSGRVIKRPDRLDS